MYIYVNDDKQLNKSSNWLAKIGQMPRAAYCCPRCIETLPSEAT